MFKKSLLKYSFKLCESLKIRHKFNIDLHESVAPFSKFFNVISIGSILENAGVEFL